MSSVRFVVVRRLATLLLLTPMISLAQLPPVKLNPAPRKTLPAMVSANLAMDGKGVYLPATVATSFALTGKGVFLPVAVNTSLTMEGTKTSPRLLQGN